MLEESLVGSPVVQIVWQRLQSGVSEQRLLMIAVSYTHLTLPTIYSV